MPMNIIEYTAITRPRRESGTIVWINVFDDEIWTIIANPIGTRSSADTTNERERENAPSRTPNATAARLNYNNIIACGPVDTSPYPQIFWACNNTAGLHLGPSRATWIYTQPNEAMEVYVR